MNNKFISQVILRCKALVSHFERLPSGELPTELWEGIRPEIQGLDAPFQELERLCKMVALNDLYLPNGRYKFELFDLENLMLRYPAGAVDRDALKTYVNAVYFDIGKLNDRKVLEFCYLVNDLVDFCVERDLLTSELLELITAPNRKAKPKKALTTPENGLQDEILSTAQVMQLLNVGKTKFQELKRDGLPFTQISPRKFVYRRSEILKWSENFRKGKHK